MRKSHTVPAGSVEWLELRQKYITATEMSSLLGVNPYQTGAKMLEEKEDLPEFVENVHTRRGKILEPAVMKLARSEWKIDAVRWAPEKAEEVLVDEELKISCTPDGRYSTPKGDVPVELKTVLLSSYLNKWLKDESFPGHYLVQLYMQIWLADAPEGYLVGMAVSNELHSLVVHMERSPKFERLIRKVLTKLEKTKEEGKKFRACKKTGQEAVEALREVSTIKWCEYSVEAREAAEEAEQAWNEVEW